MFVVKFDSNSTPDSQGWSDPVSVLVDDKIVFSGIGSTCPNSCRPSNSKGWQTSYGWLKAGIYTIRTVTHPRYGRCVILNGGGSVSSRNANTNHNGEHILTEVFIHAGNRGSSNPEWRGSAGCPTIHPLYWDKFSKALPDGSGVLIISDSQAVKI